MPALSARSTSITAGSLRCTQMTAASTSESNSAHVQQAQAGIAAGGSERQVLVSFALGGLGQVQQGPASQLEGPGRIPRVDTVEKLANVLRVSACFLAFGVEQPCQAGADSLSAGLPARLAQLRQERGLSRMELGELSGTSHTFVRDD